MRGASPGLHPLADDASAGRTVVARRRMAARQFPHRSRGASRHPARPAAGVLSAAAEDRRRRVCRPAADLRAGARADSVQRRTPRFAAAPPVHHRLPVGHAPDDGRALGVAVGAEAGAGRAPARQGRAPRDQPHPSARGRSPGRRLETPARARARWPARACIRPSSSACCSDPASGRRPRALRHELDAALAARGQTVEDAIRSEARHQAPSRRSWAT